jgi:hypothetical protein
MGPPFFFFGGTDIFYFPVRDIHFIEKPCAPLCVDLPAAVVANHTRFATSPRL